MLLYEAYASVCLETHCSMTDKSNFVPCVSSVQALSVQALFIYLFIYLFLLGFQSHVVQMFRCLHIKKVKLIFSFIVWPTVPNYFVSPVQ
jgi:hypothetical protein